MLVAHIDGASRGNPGHAAYGVCVFDAAGAEVARIGEYLGRQTNNYAEYQGLIAALRWALDNGVEELMVRSDSQLLVRQMQGRYKVKSVTLRPLWQKASELAAALGNLHLEHVRRESNIEADSLANDVLDARSGC